MSGSCETLGFTHVREEALLSQLAENLVGSVQTAKDNVLTVVIDGKAAAGKSTLAENLAEQVGRAAFRACVQCEALILEADWYLKARTNRTELMRELSTDPVWNALLVPPDFHLRFWNWVQLNQALAQVRKLAANGGGTVTLAGLYDREDNGECSGTKEIVVKSDAILLVPGSYLLSQIDAADVSILLYVNKEEGRRRKMSREMAKGSFPSGERIGEVLSSWELIEEPSFLHHMLRYGDFANVILDTSDPESFSLLRYELTGRRRPPRVRGSVRTRGSSASGTSLLPFLRQEAARFGSDAAAVITSPAGGEIIVEESERRAKIVLPSM